MHFLKLMKGENSKIISICKGWYRLLFKKRSQLSKDRLAICWTCELRKGRFCGVCFCELDALSELTEEEGGECHAPNGSRWKWLERYHQIGGF